MKAHVEVLEDAQRTLLARLGPAAEAAGFVLGGGTAIALHLGHRVSADFDWFTAGDFDPHALAKEFDVAVADVADGTLHADADGVRVSFLRFPYRTLVDPVPLDGFGCRAASLDDLAAMKLAAVAQRGTKRDFVDVHALVHAIGPLDRLIELYRRKFDVADATHVAVALAYFDDAEADPMPRMLSGVSWGAVRSDLQARVKAL